MKKAIKTIGIIYLILMNILVLEAQDSKVNIRDIRFKKLKDNKIQISYKNDKSHSVDIRYREEGGRWNKVNKISNPHILEGLKRQKSYKIQFRYYYENWNNGNFKTYKFDTKKYGSNILIREVKFKKVGIGKVEVSYINDKPSDLVDIRYRRQGYDWQKEYMISSPHRLEGLLSGENYEIQFRYYYEKWDDGGFKTYKFETKGDDANIWIKQVKFRKIANKVQISYKSAKNHSINMRYRKIGTIKWNGVDGINNPYTIKGLKGGDDYEIQFSYYYERWENGGFKTYNFDTKYDASNFFIREVKFRKIANKVQISYKNDKTYFVNMRYRKRGGAWKMAYKINTPHTLEGLIAGDDYEIQFSYYYERWENGGFKTYNFDTRYDASNSFIREVKFRKIDDNRMQINYKNDKPYSIDIRYRKKGGAWKRAYKINNPLTLDGLEVGKDYEIQFSYYYEKWSNGGFKTYKFDMRLDASNDFIREVKFRKIANKVQISYKNDKSHSVDIRYRKRGSGWKRLYKIGNPHTLEGLRAGGDYDIQFSYPHERWSNGGFKTYNFDTKYDASNSFIRDIKFRKISGNKIQIDYKNDKPYSVDIRYRKKGGVWSKLFKINNPLTLEGLSGGENYEVQFSYYYESWATGGFKTYNFDTKGMSRNVYWIHGLGGNDTSLKYMAKNMGGGYVSANVKDNWDIRNNRFRRTLKRYKYFDKVFDKMYNIHPEYNEEGEGIEKAANLLSAQIRKNKNNIFVAHSMGGLVSKQLYKDNNNSYGGLITIGTPHLGSKLAQKVVESSGEKINDLKIPPKAELNILLRTIYHHFTSGYNACQHGLATAGHWAGFATFIFCCGEDYYKMWNGVDDLQSFIRKVNTYFKDGSKASDIFGHLIFKLSEKFLRTKENFGKTQTCIDIAHESSKVMELNNYFRGANIPKIAIYGNESGNRKFFSLIGSLMWEPNTKHHKDFFVNQGQDKFKNLISDVMHGFRSAAHFEQARANFIKYTSWISWLWGTHYSNKYGHERSRKLYFNGINFFENNFHKALDILTGSAYEEKDTYTTYVTNGECLEYKRYDSKDSHIKNFPKEYKHYQEVARCIKWDKVYKTRIRYNYFMRESDGLLPKKTQVGMPGALELGVGDSKDGVNHEEMKTHDDVRDMLEKIFNGDAGFDDPNKNIFFKLERVK